MSYYSARLVGSHKYEIASFSDSYSHPLALYYINTKADNCDCPSRRGDCKHKSILRTLLKAGLYNWFFDYDKDVLFRGPFLYPEPSNSHPVSLLLSARSLDIIQQSSLAA